MTVKQAAEALGVSERTIQLWLKEGTIKGERFGVRAWAIPKREIERRRKLGLPTRGRPVVKQAAEEKLKRQRRREGKADEPS